MSRTLALISAAGFATIMAACSSPAAPDEAIGGNGDAIAAAAAVPPGATALPAPASKSGPSVLLKVPGDSPGPPFYSLSGNGGFLPHDGEWAVIPFVRDLACVPPAQDLLVLAAPAAFACTLLVEGQEHWQNGPGIDPAPRQTHFRGLGNVALVFARWSEVEPAMAGGLYLPELMALPSVRVGAADVYNEANVLGISGPHGPGKGSYTITARGTLPDQTPFDVHINEVLGELRVVQVRFGG